MHLRCLYVPPWENEQRRKQMYTVRRLVIDYLNGIARRQVGSGPPLGGFNVSNLMGIKRRIIDIGKKITFYFLKNV
jgi:hypothetical protein